MGPAIDAGNWIWDHTLGPVTSTVVGGAWDQVVGGLVAWVTDAVAWFVAQLLALLNKTGEVNLTAHWFVGDGSATAGAHAPFLKVTLIAGVLLVGFVFLAIIQGILAGAPGEMLARIARDLPLAVLGMAATVTVAQTLIAVTDQLALAILDGSGDDARRVMTGLAKAGSLSGNTFVVFLLGILAIVAALVVWVELIIRAALIYLLIAMSPLAFAASVWPAARGVLRKLMELTVAVILSKVVVALAFAVGGAALAGAGNAAPPGAGLADQATASVGTLFAGTVIFVLAAFAPFVVLRLFPAAEAAIVAQGLSRSPGHAAQSAASSTFYLQRLSGAATSGAPADAGAGGAAPLAAGPGVASGAAGGAAAAAAL